MSKKRMRSSSLAPAWVLACVLGGVVAAPTWAAPPDLSAVQVLPGDEGLTAAAGLQEQPVIAAGADGYLAVWTDARSSVTLIAGFTNGPYFSPGVGTMRDIYAARLDADGNLIDRIPIVVEHAPMNQGFVDVAWNGENWLVVWMGQDGISCCADVNIYGARVAPSGAVLDDPPIVIDTDATGNGLYWPAVVSDGVGWAVVWRDLDQEAGIFTIDGARVSAEGAVIDTGGKRLRRDSQNSYPTWPDLALAGDEYLMVWEESSGTIRGQRLSRALDKIGSVFRINPASDAGFHPTVASDGEDYFVAWFHDAYAWNQVFASRVTHNGQVLDPAAIQVTPFADYTQFLPHVVWGGSNWVVGYNIDASGFEGDIYVTRVSTDGQVLDPTGIPVTTAAGSQIDPCLAPRPGGGIQFVWHEQGHFQPLVEDIYTGSLSADGVPGPIECIALSAPRQRDPDFVAAGDGYLAVFLSETSFGSRVLGQRISRTGRAIDPEPFEIGSSVTGISHPSVAWDGTRYLVTWSTRESIVFARRVAADGSMIDAQPFQVMPGDSPDVAALGDVFLVVATYAQYPHFRYPYSTRIRGTDGAKLDSTPMLAGWTFATNVSVARLGSRWLLVWQQNPSHDNFRADVAGNFIEATGVPGSPFFVTSTSITIESSPFVSCGADTALIVWEDDPTGAYNDNIKGRRILPNGTMLDGGGVVLSTAPSLQDQPALGWTGNEYALLFTDFRNDNLDGPYVGDVYGTRVSGHGVPIDPDDFALVGDPEVAELDPTVAGAGGEAALGCAAFQIAAPYGNYRIVYRLMNQDPFTSEIGDPDSFASSVSLHPNPSSGEVLFGFHMEQPGLANVEIFDAAGRLVRRLGENRLPDGPASIVWDGHDSQGQRTGAGVYFARLVTPTGGTLVKITRR